MRNEDEPVSGADGSGGLRVTRLCRLGRITGVTSDETQRHHQRQDPRHDALFEIGHWLEG